MPDAAPDTPQGDVDRKDPDAGPGAHDVQTHMGAIKADVGERAARKFTPSAFASLPPEQLQELEEACDRYDFCDPVPACRITGLWESCVNACRKSGKCPPEMLSGGDPGG